MTNMESRTVSIGTVDKLGDAICKVQGVEHLLSEMSAATHLHGNREYENAFCILSDTLRETRYLLDDALEEVKQAAGVLSAEEILASRG